MVGYKSKSKSIFICASCGNQSIKWEGRCSACGDWNTVDEMPRYRARKRSSDESSQLIRELSQIENESVRRMCLSSEEINRVLGGGIVPGSLVLVAGDPGIGKSTMLLWLASDVADAIGDTIYVTGEESPAQIKMRADRVGVEGRNLYLMPVTDLDEIIGQLEERKPVVAIIDSIQTICDASITSEPGSVTQIKECARKLLECAKSNDISIVMSGHVTKVGDVAGPRILEHIVDVVLYMEGDSVNSLRLLRTKKNRFGSTDEIGIFQMTESGLEEVKDPSRTFLPDHHRTGVGSVITSVIEGSRPLLAEIQALTTKSISSIPRRVSSGVEFNRLLLVCAVLTRRLGMSLATQDVVVNVAGGLKIREPSADLGLALAIVSALRNVPINPDIVAIGEIGLSGEIRVVPQIERRISEVDRLGFKRCVVPSGKISDSVFGGKLEVTQVNSLDEAVRQCLESNSGESH
jgi:DNA repair protein RadA/Sms